MLPGATMASVNGMRALWSRCRDRSSPELLAGLAIGAFFLLWMGPTGHDLGHHLARTEEVYAALQRGDDLLVFSRATARGRPLPVYLYYSQFVYWIPSLFKFLGASTLLALKLSLVACWFALASGASRLAFRLYSFVGRSPDRGGLLLSSTLLWGGSYLSALVLTRMALAEVVAAAGIVWASAELLSPRPRLRLGAVVGLTVALASHPLSVMNCAPLLITLGVAGAGRRTGGLVWGALEGVLSFGAAAFSVIPAFLAKDFVLGHRGVPRKVPSFRHLGELLDPLAPIAIGPALVLALVLCFGIWVAKRPSSWLAGALLALVIGYGGLLNSISAPLWKSSPALLSNIFTFRMLLPFSIAGGSFCTLVLASQLRGPSPWWGRSALIASLTPFAATLWTAPRLDQAATDAVLARQVSSILRRTQGFGIGEYSPRVPESERMPASCVPRRGKGASGVPKRVRSAVAGECLLTDLYWSPFYSATVGGTPVRVFGVAKTGSLVVALEGRSGDLRVSWRYPTREFCAVVSLTSILLIAAWLALGPLVNRRPSRQP